MNPPVLLVMAAGMGSRYGGPKQVDPMGPTGQVILDYSVYDAYRAGFRSVIFVIKPDMEADFREKVGDRIARRMDVQYVYQLPNDLPEGYRYPQGRVKPWGTAHAVLAARKLIHGPFAVINADDYYGPEGLEKIYRFLTRQPEGYGYAMVGYRLENTVTEYGAVARGVCLESAAGQLLDIQERTRIEKGPDGPRFTEDGGKTWQTLPGDTVVSMNLWGFTETYLQEAWARFPAFLEQTLRDNPLKGEYYLPSVVGQLLSEGRATVQVLHSDDTWFGVTYPEDKERVKAAILRMTQAGQYPELF